MQQCVQFCKFCKLCVLLSIKRCFATFYQDVDAYGGCKVSYPIIADEKRELAVALGMIDPDEKTKAGLPLTCRAVSLTSYLFTTQCARGPTYIVTKFERDEFNNIIC